MAQEEHTWHIRKQPEIRQIFEECIFATDDGPEECCVSLDGCCALFRPCESQLKLHVDLVPEIPGADWGVVQGAYNLYPVTADIATGKGNAGFVCVVGSHKQYNSMWETRMANKQFKMPNKHWHILEEDSPYQKESSLITSPANSLVLWRADLLHKNYGGDYTCTELGSSTKPRLTRLTQFITYMPKKFRTEKVRIRKAQAVLDGVCNNHWAALAFRVPLKPFPAWSKPSNAIKIVIPTFPILEEEEVVVNNKRTRDGIDGKKKTKSPLNSLPADIVSLL